MKNNSLAGSGSGGTIWITTRVLIGNGLVSANGGDSLEICGEGYVTTKNNRKIAFALIVNNYNCTAYQMKKKMELIMIKLAEIER